MEAGLRFLFVLILLAVSALALAGAAMLISGIVLLSRRKKESSLQVSGQDDQLKPGTAPFLLIAFGAVLFVPSVVYILVRGYWMLTIL